MSSTLPTPHRTHEVKNQPPPLEGYNAFTENLPLVEALRREGGAWAEARAAQLGEICGSPEAQEWATEANENPPVLHTHDRFGHRLDEVRFHPSWHQLMRTSVAYGIHALPWREPKPGAHVARAAMFITMSALEGGHLCPISMTYSVVPALRVQKDISAEWEGRFTSLEYDPRFLPVTEKKGALSGMGMTEKQGGSDVRANSTQAKPLGQGGPGAEYVLEGHKWFCSAPMCDSFLVLAQAPGGLSCFFLPRFLPDGTKNRFFLQRLKNKLGNRSNASSEVEFDGTWARLVGEEGRGVPTIIEMVNHTRLDCVLGSTSLMRAAAVQALHHTSHRAAFGKRLVEQPLMRNVLADLCLESEAANLVALRLARAYDEAAESPRAATFRRLATAVSKYWICKRGPHVVAEALECLGGNGYIETSLMPRLFRESPLNSIWEGSGNVICLDVLRALLKSPESAEAFFEELAPARSEPRLAAYLDALSAELVRTDDAEIRARRLVEKLALAFQAALMVQHAPAPVASAFIASRLDGDWGHAFGTLPKGTDFQAILSRHWTRE